MVCKRCSASIGDNYTNCPKCGIEITDYDKISHYEMLLRSNEYSLNSLSKSSKYCLAFVIFGIIMLVLNLSIGKFNPGDLIIILAGVIVYAFLFVRKKALIEEIATYKKIVTDLQRRNNYDICKNCGFLIPHGGTCSNCGYGKERTSVEVVKPKSKMKLIKIIGNIVIVIIFIIIIKNLNDYSDTLVTDEDQHGYGRFGLLIYYPFIIIGAICALLAFNTFMNSLVKKAAISRRR